MRAHSSSTAASISATVVVCVLRLWIALNLLLLFCCGETDLMIS
jgi:hypothetical protein